MRHLLMCFFLTGCFLLSGPFVFAQDKKPEKPKSTAAVLEFKALTMIKKEEIISLTNKFRSSLAQTNQFILLGRSDMEVILKEQDFSMSDLCNSEECAVEVGQLLAAEKMITGDLGKVGNTYTVTVRILDVSTGEVERTASAEYKGETEGLIQTFDELAQKLTGIYKSNNRLYYILGGVALAGGSALGAILLSGGGGSKPTTVGKPPGSPQVP